MLIPLVCTQCGAQLQIEQSQVIQAGDSVIVLENQTFKCQHCGMQYLPGRKLNYSPTTPMISVGGSIKGSTIIIGNNFSVDSSAYSDDEDDEEEYEDDVADAQVEKPLSSNKKWWEFWKK